MPSARRCQGRRSGRGSRAGHGTGRVRRAVASGRWATAATGDDAGAGTAVRLVMGLDTRWSPEPGLFYLRPVDSLEDHQIAAAASAACAGTPKPSGMVRNCSRRAATARAAQGAREGAAVVCDADPVRRSSAARGPKRHHALHPGGHPAPTRDRRAAGSVAGLRRQRVPTADHAGCSGAVSARRDVAVPRGASARPARASGSSTSATPTAAGARRDGTTQTPSSAPATTPVRNPTPASRHCMLRVMRRPPRSTVRIVPSSLAPLAKGP
jgi:hypothetical protein